MYILIKRITLLTLVLLLCSIPQGNAQVKSQHKVATATDASQSEISLTPIELKVLLKKLILLKRQRQRLLLAQQKLRSQQKMAQATQLQQRLLNMEQLLAQQAKPTTSSSTKPSPEVYNSTTNTATAENSAELQQQLKALNEAINRLSTPMPATIISSTDRDSAQSLQLEKYYRDHTQQMLTLQQRMDTLQIKFSQQLNDNNNQAFAERLTRIENSIQNLSTQPDTLYRSLRPTDNNQQNWEVAFAEIQRSLESLKTTSATPIKSETDENNSELLRNLQALQKQISTLQTELDAQKSVVRSTTTSDNSNQEVLAEIKALRSQLKTLNANPSKGNGNNITVLPKLNSNNNKVLLAEIKALQLQVQELKGDTTSFDSLNVQAELPYDNHQEVLTQIKAIQVQLDELKNRPVANPTTKATLTDEQLLAAWDARFKALENKISEIKPGQEIVKETITERIVPVPVAPKVDTSYNWLKTVIAGKEKRRLLYDNNATVTKQTDLPILADTKNLMQQHSALDILITGYTSAKGSPAYNKLLSEKRAENVKKYLMKQGIHPNRIFTEYHGIDYQATRPAEGRRVEILLMIRK